MGRDGTVFLVLLRLVGGGVLMRVVIADDSVLFREGLARLLCERGFDVVAQTANADDLLRRVGGLRPDVAVVDVRMPPTYTDEGLRAGERICERYPQVGVLVLSQYVASELAMRLLAAGAAGRGYLLKDRVGDLDVFAEAIRRVGSGGSVIDPEVVAQLVHRPRAARRERTRPADRTRAADPRPDARGSLERGDLRAAGAQPPHDREPHPHHLSQARPRRGR